MDNKYSDFKELVNEFYEGMVNTPINQDKVKDEFIGKIRIEFKVILEENSGTIKVESYVGYKNKLYKIKSLSEFYMLFVKKQNYKYSDSLEFIHTQDAFEDESKEKLDFLLKYARYV